MWLVILILDYVLKILDPPAFLIKQIPIPQILQTQTNTLLRSNIYSISPLRTSLTRNTPVRQTHRIISRIPVIPSITFTNSFCNNFITIRFTDCTNTLVSLTELNQPVTNYFDVITFGTQFFGTNFGVMNP